MITDLSSGTERHNSEREERKRRERRRERRCDNLFRIVIRFSHSGHLVATTFRHSTTRPNRARRPGPSLHDTVSYAGRHGRGVLGRRARERVGGKNDNFSWIQKAQQKFRPKVTANGTGSMVRCVSISELFFLFCRAPQPSRAGVATPAARDHRQGVGRGQGP